MPMWTNLSTSGMGNQLASGKSFPGMHIKNNTNKNQAMPGMNFLICGFLFVVAVNLK